MFRKTNGIVFLLIVGAMAGCSPGKYNQPANYLPATGYDDPGPWPIVLNRHFYAYWISAGPYNSGWVPMGAVSAPESARSIENQVQIQPVAHSEDALEYKLEVTDANSVTVLLRAYSEPDPTILKLGKLELPLDMKHGARRGNICSVDREIATFDFAEDTATNAENETISQLVLEDRIITIRLTPEPEKTFLEQMVSNGFLSFDYMDGSERVGFLQWRPDKQLWIDSTLPASVRLAIAANAAMSITGFETADRQQAAAQTTIYIPAN